MNPITWLIVALCIAEAIFLILLYLTWRWGKPKREPGPNLLIMPNGEVVHDHETDEERHLGYVHHHKDGHLPHTHGPSDRYDILP
jgi:hypothetical protein